MIIVEARPWCTDQRLWWKSSCWPVGRPSVRVQEEVEGSWERSLGAAARHLTHVSSAALPRTGHSPPAAAGHLAVVRVIWVRARLVKQLLWLLEVESGRWICRWGKGWEGWMGQEGKCERSRCQFFCRRRLAAAASCSSHTLPNPQTP